MDEHAVLPNSRFLAQVLQPKDLAEANLFVKIVFETFFNRNLPQGDAQHKVVQQKDIHTTRAIHAFDPLGPSMLSNWRAGDAAEGPGRGKPPP